MSVMRSACAAILVAEAEADEDEKGAGSTPDAMVKGRNTHAKANQEE
jgi:hypothetical protein